MGAAVTVVQAVCSVTEFGFNGEGEFEHARPGDFGLVQSSDGEYSVVTWNRTGTTVEVHAGEVRPVFLTSASLPAQGGRNGPLEILQRPGVVDLVRDPGAELG